LIAVARLGGLSAVEAEKCLADQQSLDDINAVRIHAEQKLAVSGTPTFIINGHKYTGNLSFEELSGIIDGLL
jgi:protein-disulfide isomerase